jgi:hypothetical protein
VTATQLMQRGNEDPPLCSPCRHSDHLDQSFCCRIRVVYIKHIQYCSDCYNELLFCIEVVLTWFSSVPPGKCQGRILNKAINTSFHLVQFTSQWSSYPSETLTLELQRALADFLQAWQSMDRILIAARFSTLSRLALGAPPSLLYNGYQVSFPDV